MKSQKALVLSPLAVVVSFALLGSLHPLTPLLRAADDPPKKTVTSDGGVKSETAKSTVMVGSSKVQARTITTKSGITVVATKAEGDKYGEKLQKGLKAVVLDGPRTPETKFSFGTGFLIEW